MPSKIPVARLGFTRGALVTVLNALQSRAQELRRLQKRHPSAARDAELNEVQTLAARFSESYQTTYGDLSGGNNATE